MISEFICFKSCYFNQLYRKKQVKKETFEQREYSNLSFLYANKNIEGDENEG